MRVRLAKLSPLHLIRVLPSIVSEQRIPRTPGLRAGHPPRWTSTVAGLREVVGNGPLRGELRAVTHCYTSLTFHTGAASSVFYYTALHTVTCAYRYTYTGAAPSVFRGALMAASQMASYDHSKVLRIVTSRYVSLHPVTCRFDHSKVLLFNTYTHVS